MAIDPNTPFRSPPRPVPPGTQGPAGTSGGGSSVSCKLAMLFGICGGVTICSPDILLETALADRACASTGGGPGGGGGATRPRPSNCNRGKACGYKRGTRSNPPTAINCKANETNVVQLRLKLMESSTKSLNMMSLRGLLASRDTTQDRFGRLNVQEKKPPFLAALWELSSS